MYDPVGELSEQLSVCCGGLRATVTTLALMQPLAVDWAQNTNTLTNCDYISGLSPFKQLTITPKKQEIKENAF